MRGFVRVVDADGRIVLIIGGLWSSNMAFELKKGDYDYIKLDQVLDWDNYLPHIQIVAEKVKEAEFFYLDLIGLECLTNLENLILPTEGVPNPRVDLTVFKKLRHFSGCWHKRYAEILHLLPDLSQIDFSKFSEKDLTLLTKVAEIKWLKLVRGRLESLDGIQNFSLNELRLYNLSKSLVDISAISTQKKLKELWIESAEKVVDLSEITILSELEVLYLQNCGKLSNIDWITNCQNLKRLVVSTTSSTIDWEMLMTLPKLKVVCIEFSSNIICSEIELFKIADKKGRILSGFTRLGTKKSPCVIFNLGVP